MPAMKPHTHTHTHLYAGRVQKPQKIIRIKICPSVNKWRRKDDKLTKKIWKFVVVELESDRMRRLSLANFHFSLPTSICQCGLWWATSYTDHSQSANLFKSRAYTQRIMDAFSMLRSSTSCSNWMCTMMCVVCVLCAMCVRAKMPDLFRPNEKKIHHSVRGIMKIVIIIINIYHSMVGYYIVYADECAQRYPSGRCHLFLLHISLSASLSLALPLTLSSAAFGHSAQKMEKLYLHALSLEIILIFSLFFRRMKMEIHTISHIVHHTIRYSVQRTLYIYVILETCARSRTHSALLYSHILIRNGLAGN